MEEEIILHHLAYTKPGSTIRTLLHGKINPKDWQALSLGDVGFLLVFRVVSGDYGKPWKPLGLFWQSTIFRGSPEVLRQELPIASTAVSIIPAGDIVPRIDRQSGVVQRSNGLQKLGKIGILVMAVMMVVVDVFFGGGARRYTRSKIQGFRISYYDYHMIF